MLIDKRDLGFLVQALVLLVPAEPGSATSGWHQWTDIIFFRMDMPHLSTVRISMIRSSTLHDRKKAHGAMACPAVGRNAHAQRTNRPMEVLD